MSIITFYIGISLQGIQSKLDNSIRRTDVLGTMQDEVKSNKGGLS